MTGLLPSVFMGGLGCWAQEGALMDPARQGPRIKGAPPPLSPPGSLGFCKFAAMPQIPFLLIILPVSRPTLVLPDRETFI